MNEVIAGIDAVDQPEPEPSAVQDAVAAVVAPTPIPATPSDLDDAAGIPPVVPDDPSNYAPGPTSEMDQWQ